MSDNRSSFSNLDQYLQTVQNREKSKFRQRFVLLLVAILGALGIIAFSNYFSLGSRPLDYQVVKASFNDLDIESVSSIFNQNQKAQLVIEYPFGFEDDTVSSLNEYLELVSADQIELTGESLSSMEVSDNPLEVPLFFIEGNQVSRSPLTFAIAKFDTSLTYSLNLGNGIVREINNQITNYSYRSSGTFSLELTVKDNLGNERSHARTIQISTPSENNSTLTDATPIEENSIENLEQARVTESVFHEPDISRLQATTTDGLNLERVDINPQDRNLGSSFTNEENQALANRNISRPSVPNPSAKETLSNNATDESTGLPNNTPENREETEPTVQNINFASSNIPLYSATKMPRFKGGKSGLVRYFSSNLRYPQEAINEEVEGGVKIRFVVEPNGRISNPEILEGIGSGCDEEAMRLVLNMPAWIPGELTDKKVPVYSQLLIKFELQ